MVIGYQATVCVQKLYDDKSEIYWYNYLSHDVVLAYEGKKGLGLIITVNIVRIKKGVHTKYIHKDGTDTKAFSKAVRYLQPIVMAKKEKTPEVGDKYKHLNTTFQSTYYYNIQEADMINQCSQYKSTKEKRSGETKCVTQR